MYRQEIEMLEAARNAFEAAIPKISLGANPKNNYLIGGVCAALGSAGCALLIAIEFLKLADKIEESSIPMPKPKPDPELN